MRGMQDVGCMVWRYLDPKHTVVQCRRAEREGPMLVLAVAAAPQLAYDCPVFFLRCVPLRTCKPGEGGRSTDDMFEVSASASSLFIETRSP